MPNAIHIDTKEDPPYEINGSVTPVVGISLIDTLTFIRAWNINKTRNPVQDIIEKGSPILFTLNKPLKNIVKMITIIEKHANKPYSSATTGNIKSVCASGILFFISPSPGPFPKIPPS